MKSTNIRSLRSLKKGTKFKWYDKNDKELMAIAGTKRGPEREVHFPKDDNTYLMWSDMKVEIIR